MNRIVFIALMMITASSWTLAQKQNEQAGPDSRSVQTTQQLAVRAELKKAEQAYTDEEFAQARLHAERALEIDPSNKDALLIVARSIYGPQFMFANSPENVSQVREAIAAYQRVLINHPANEEAYNAVAILYGQIGEDELLYSWVIQRALNETLPVAKRAEAYLYLAKKNYMCSFEITDANEVTQKDDDSRVVATYSKPEDRREFERAQQCAARGMQMTEAAISLTPESDFAWSMKVNLLLEMSKLAEMEEKHERSKEYKRLAQETSDRATELREKRVTAEVAHSVTIECGALCDKAINLPVPPYPSIARSARATGSVIIQIIIDEEGAVSSATAASGPPLLRAASVQAAQRSLFSPTILDGQRVKVTGTLTYNFTLP